VLAALVFVDHEPPQNAAMDRPGGMVFAGVKAWSAPGPAVRRRGDDAPDGNSFSSTGA
jgi:hypothetical protein